MDAVKFIEERNRMCDSYSESCDGCPLYLEHCRLLRNIDGGHVVSAVEQWSAAHPRKTRQSVFLEQYPNARVTAKGIVNIWPCEVEKNMQNAIL
jgi:hypothetical protein